MPTLGSGVRRAACRRNPFEFFCDKIGVAKRENLIDIGLPILCSEHLTKIALRRMVVVTDPESGHYQLSGGPDRNLPTENNTARSQCRYA